LTAASQGSVDDSDGVARKIVSVFASSRPVTLSILFLGAALRSLAFLFNRSLWHDEANITLDVMERSALELFEPTTLYEQTAPIGWLLTEWVSGRLFAFSEQGMRAWPYLASLLALPLFWVVARRGVGPLGAQIGLLILAVSTPAIHFANEVKPYSSDVTFILLVYLIGSRLLEPHPSRRARVVAAWGGAMMIWFSHPAVFGLTAVGLLGLWVRWQKRDAAEFRRDLPVWILWGASLAICYVTYLRRLIQDSELTDYWAAVAGYAPLVPRSVPDLLWYRDTFVDLFQNAAGITAAGLGGFFFLWGAVVMWRHDRTRLALFLLPALLALVASGFGRYAFTGRLTLFAAPGLLLLIGAAFVFANKWCAWAGPWVVGIATTLLLVGPVYDAAVTVKNPECRDEVREALDFIQAQTEPGDAIYLSSGSLKPYLYYKRVGRFSREVIINGNRHGHNHFDWSRVGEDLEVLAGEHRVWVMFSGVWRAKGLDEEEVFLEQARRLGRSVRQDSFAGVNVYLFDFSGG
jgi:hypothetical protein